ncbi:MAG TPA: SDR family oxidoreductase [Planctomycetota bacterium]|nr:SDR family oxidoreductase [Planctomycetota bacterium]
MAKHAIVIGGGMGIGEAIVRKLHADGWTLTIADRAADDAAKLAASLGERATAEWVDITREEQLAGVMKNLRERAGADGVMAAINSVGIYDDRRPLLQSDLASFNRMFNVNVAGAFLFSKAVEPLLAKDASLVHISSVNARLAGARLGAYKVSKAALNMLVRCLASELARDPRRIRVNAVAPGWVDTPGERRVQAAQGTPDAFVDPASLKYIPMQRMTQATEIADAVAFLCSPAASAITGQIIHVDCGISNSEV